jgi:hypothetical protein
MVNPELVYAFAYRFAVAKVSEAEAKEPCVHGSLFLRIPQSVQLIFERGNAGGSFIDLHFVRLNVHASSFSTKDSSLCLEV